MRHDKTAFLDLGYIATFTLLPKIKVLKSSEIIKYYQNFIRKISQNQHINSSNKIPKKNGFKFHDSTMDILDPIVPIFIW